MGNELIAMTLKAMINIFVNISIHQDLLYFKEVNSNVSVIVYSKVL